MVVKNKLVLGLSWETAAQRNLWMIKEGWCGGVRTREGRDGEAQLWLTQEDAQSLGQHCLFWVDFLSQQWQHRGFFVKSFA